jgi:hypothetical protein
MSFQDRSIRLKYKGLFLRVRPKKIRDPAFCAQRGASLRAPQMQAFLRKYLSADKVKPLPFPAEQATKRRDKAHPHGMRPENGLERTVLFVSLCAQRI